MQQWEYRIVPEEIDWDEETDQHGIEKNRLSQLGNEGWELVGVVPINGPLEDGCSCTVEIQYLFKRPKQEKASPPKKTKTASSHISSDDIALLQSYADRHQESEIATSGIVGRLQGALKKNGLTNFAPISAEDVTFIQSYIDRNPKSDLAKSGILGRLQS